MRIFRTDITTALATPLTPASRLLVLVAALSLIPALMLPLWHMTFLAQQYPEGLDLFIYASDLVGGDGGNDLNEINVLNHYIGMAELRAVDFTELKWIPLIVGLLGVLTLRAAAVGSLGSVVDVIVMSVYFGLFSVWSFYHKLYVYGHNLDPRAAVKVDPFTPPVFGYRMVGQFEVWSYPSAGTWFFVAFGVLLLAGLYVTYSKRVRSGT
jgi:hypothetical protein